MSLSNNIQNTIQNTIISFVEEVSNKYNLNKNDLLKIWNGSREKSDIIPQNEIKDEIKDSQLNTLLKLSKNELVELCKNKSIKVTGSKTELAERIILSESSKKIENKIPNGGDKISIVKKLVEKIPSIHLKRNKFENFEHVETSFVFNNKTQKVYGKQNEDGSVSNLTAVDIDICNKYKFTYYIPDNLDKTDDMKKDSDCLDDLDIEEDLDDEEFEEEFEEELEEEEEYYEEE